MIVRDTLHIIHITFDALVTIAQGLAITVEEVDIPRDDGNSTSPVQPVVCTISPSTSWNNIGQHSVGLLFVTMVGQPFFVNGNSIKVIKCCLNGKMTVTSPTVLLALRAIGGVAHQIGKVRVIGSMEQLAYQWARRFQATYCRHITVHEVSNQAVLVKLNRLICHYLHITKSLVIKSGHELILFSTQNENVRLKRVFLLIASKVDINVREIEAAIWM